LLIDGGVAGKGVDRVENMGPLHCGEVGFLATTEYQITSQWRSWISCH
jgi:hypothetical protein